MMANRPVPRESQRGIALIIILLALIAVSGVFLLAGMVTNSSNRQGFAGGSSREVRLQTARDALVGHAVGAFGGGTRPGQLPPPDTLANGNYDGNADANSCLDGSKINGQPVLSGAAAKSANLRCLGRLPWKTLGLESGGADANDPTGILAWYAVSANLAEPNFCLQYLNPGTVAQAPVSFVCPSAVAPPFPWLKVCDQTGQLLSDRVAFVVIIPGPPITTMGRAQSRSGLPAPADFLDGIAIPAGWGSLPANQRCTTYDNAALTNEFVIADEAEGFNDRLMYVTIDELMAAVERRITQQVREALLNYQVSYGRYPWLIPLMNPATAIDTWLSVNNTVSGLVPFHTQGAGQKFLTEMSWSIGTGAASDSLTPTTSSSPAFLCFGNVYRCRLRTSSGTAPIPRTVSSADLAPLKSSAVATPAVACSYSTASNLDCDVYTYTVSTQPVTYDLQRRLASGGTYTYYGTYSGVQTRTASLLLTGLQAPTPPAATTIADINHFVRRSVTTTASMNTFGMLSLTDTWVPNGAGAPFDMSAGPFQTGKVSTNGAGVVAASNIRFYPELPKWYVVEKWQEYIYAAISPDASPVIGGATCGGNCFSAGTRVGITAVVISSGKMIGTQNRYIVSPTIADFLEAPNVTGVSTRIFADTTASQSNSYADTIATIPQ